jgi:ABC-2 type transport system permease protein
MNKTAIWALAKKDMRMIGTNTQIWLPMIIVPLLLGVILPGALVWMGKSLDLSSMKGMDAIAKLIEKLPSGGLRDTLMGMPDMNHQLVYLVVNYMFAGMFLLIPVMASSVIGSNSFVGEKERRTLESLLFAPISVMELFLGKMLSAFLPSMALSVGTFLLYGIVVDSFSYGMFDGLIFPSWNWIVLILWVTPALSLCTILACVLISARVKGFQEAQQLSGVIVLPVLALVVGQMSGVMFLSAFVMFLIGAVLLLLCLVLLRPIMKMNQRHVLFERQVH